jgi:hypothetical protein
MGDAIRIYCLVLSALVIVIGSLQAGRWPTFTARERMHWLATAVINFGLLIGSVEFLTKPAPPVGFRNYLVMAGLTWLLAAVLYDPVTRWRARRTKKESP